MPRLRHKVSGVVVNVDDATAAQLGAEYEPITEPKPVPKKAAPQRSTRK